jgi:GntR family transcriptional repressor for pyruvate dehydrogenase complex
VEDHGAAWVYDVICATPAELRDPVALRYPKVRQSCQGKIVPGAIVAGEARSVAVSDELARIRPARRRSLPEEIVDQLLELIASAGESEFRMPPERALCLQLGVSRTSLREALSALVHLGVLETQGKTKLGIAARARAQLVARVSDQASERQLVTDPLEVRRILEPEAAALAADRGSKRDFDEIAEWLRLMEAALERGERVVEYDSAFHVAIARAAGNVVLVQLVSAVADALQHSRELSFMQRNAGPVAVAGHKRILTALRERDAEGAGIAMRAHVDDVARLVQVTLDGGVG